MADLLGTFYQTQVSQDGRVVTTETRDVAAAEAVVESRGSGSIIKWHGDYNMPNCLPKIVSRSCAMWTYDKGVWYAVPIFGGSGRWEERPSTKEVAWDYNEGCRNRISLCEVPTAPAGEARWLVQVDSSTVAKYLTREDAQPDYDARVKRK